MVLGGSNGTYVTTKSENLSKFTAIVQLHDGEKIEIPVKNAIRQFTRWEKITKKRSNLIINNFPKNVHVYQDEPYGHWRISDEDMRNWANMIIY